MSKPPHQLTHRQIGIIRLVATGLGDKEIARTLGISPWTVRTILRRLSRHYDARGRIQLVLKVAAAVANLSPFPAAAACAKLHS